MYCKLFLMLSLIILIILINKKSKYIYENFDNQQDLKNICIYVINLKKDIERLRNFKKSITKNNLEFNRFDAIDAKKIPDDDLRLKIFDNVKKVKFNKAQKCCYLSHLNTLKKLKKKKKNLNLIFEDDVIIPIDFIKKLQNYVTQLPDNWDILFLGGNKIIGRKHSKNIIEPEFTTKGNYGAFAYLIKGSSIDKIIDICSNVEYHYDIQLQNGINQGLNLFFTYPHLIKHNYNYFSNNFNKKRNHESKKRNKITILN